MPDNKREEESLRARSLAFYSLLFALPQLVAALVFGVASVGLLLGWGAGREWLGLSSIALVVGEIDRRLTHAVRFPRAAVFRAAVRLCYVALACAAAAVAFPVQWWLPPGVTILVL